MATKIKNSKYGIEYSVDFADNLGRYVATFTSPSLGISAQYLVRDQDREYDDSLLYETEQLLALNFWFICLQKEQNDNADKQQPAAQPAAMGPVRAEPAGAENG